MSRTSQRTVRRRTPDSRNDGFAIEWWKIALKFDGNMALCYTPVRAGL